MDILIQFITKTINATSHIALEEAKKKLFFELNYFMACYVISRHQIICHVIFSCYTTKKNS